MEYPKYDIETSLKSDIYEFTSIGIKGKINKIVEFETTENPLIYNLAMGDKVEITMPDGSVQVVMDTDTISENGDRDKVLATVAAVVHAYTLIYNERWVFFKGNNEIKTRLYRMAISKNYEELSKLFYIFGVIIVDGVRVPVIFNGNSPFNGFIVKRK